MYFIRRLCTVATLLTLVAFAGCTKVVIANKQQSRSDGFKVTLPNLTNPVPGFAVVSGGVLQGPSGQLRAGLQEVLADF